MSYALLASSIVLVKRVVEEVNIVSSEEWKKLDGLLPHLPKLWTFSALCCGSELRNAVSRTITTTTAFIRMSNNGL